jgi:hypothetical protein
MKKALPNHDTILRLGDVLRSARKHLGWNQTEAAPRLGLNQSTLSRVEVGKQMLTAVQWFTFCKQAGITPESAALGYFEMSRPESAMRLPSRYTFEKHSKVRSLIPMLRYAEATLGETGFNNFLKTAQVDPDFFLNLNASINFNFTLDLIGALILKASLTEKDADSVTRTAAEPSSHGSLHHLFDSLASNPLELISGFVQQSQKYGDNFRYEIVGTGRSKIDVSVTPLPHMKSFAYEEFAALGKFLVHYEKGFFQNLGAYGGHRPLKGSILESHYDGAPRSVYRLKISA